MGRKKEMAQLRSDIDKAKQRIDAIESDFFSTFGQVRMFAPQPSVEPWEPTAHTGKTKEWRWIKPPPPPPPGRQVEPGRRWQENSAGTWECDPSGVFWYHVPAPPPPPLPSMTLEELEELIGRPRRAPSKRET